MFDATTAWVADIEKGPRAILAQRFPNAPNLGDVTTVDWTKVEPVDIIAGGSPCQDLSHVGKRQGMRAGTRSGLWASMCDAIKVIRPSWVVWENVRGALSAEADSGMEPCAGCVGDEPNGADGPVLRALGRVLGDLADLGYDAQWVSLRAADVGACHGRFRVFVLAWPTPNSDGGRGRRGATPSRRRPREGADATVNGAGLGDDGSLVADPRGIRDGCEVDPRGMGSKDTKDDRRGNASCHTSAIRGGAIPCDQKRTDTFGPYFPAVARWEQTLGREAPCPTEPDGKTGKPRLSSRFVEWMMGLPDGWVTDCGLSRNDQIRALGNGVVPQQATAALRWLLNTREET